MKYHRIFEQGSHAYRTVDASPFGAAVSGKEDKVSNKLQQTKLKPQSA